MKRFFFVFLLFPLFSFSMPDKKSPFEEGTPAYKMWLVILERKNKLLLNQRTQPSETRSEIEVPEDWGRTKIKNCKTSYSNLAALALQEDGLPNDDECVEKD